MRFVYIRRAIGGSRFSVLQQESPLRDVLGCSWSEWPRVRHCSMDLTLSSFANALVWLTHPMIFNKMADNAFNYLGAAVKCCGGNPESVPLLRKLVLVSRSDWPGSLPNLTFDSGMDITQLDILMRRNIITAFLHGLYKCVSDTDVDHETWLPLYAESVFFEPLSSPPQCQFN